MLNRKEFLGSGVIGGTAISLFSSKAFFKRVGSENLQEKRAAFNIKLSSDFNIFNQEDGASLEEQIEWG